MNKGFSLVELIVVIAIMAILVGVAVPVYTSYINEANEAKAEQYEDELERAVATAVVDVKAGLTDTTKDKTIPATIKIVGNKIYSVDGSTETELTSSALADAINAIIKLDSTSTTPYTFNINATTGAVSSAS